MMKKIWLNKSLRGTSSTSFWVTKQSRGLIFGLLLITIHLITVHYLYAQSWTTYNTGNGLANNYVNAIAIDTAGVKWFGTDNGVSKFNGTNWTTYRFNDGLANNVVYSIAIDTSDVKWFGTNGGGVSKFDGTTWTTYITTQGFNNNSVRAIAIDNTGTKWFGTNNGVNKFDGTTWTTYTTDSGLAANEVISIAIDSQGTKWFGTYGGGVSKFDGTTWVTYNYSNTNQKLLNNIVNSIAIDNAGNKWFGTNSGVSKFDGTNWTTYTTTTPFGLSGNLVNSVVIDSADNKWFGTDNGVSKFDGTNWTSYTTANGLAGSNVYRIAVDSTSTKWLSTYGYGVCKLSPTGTFSGNVTDGSVPLANVTIEVINSQSAVIGSTTTNANGNYTVTASTGTYDVRASISRYTPHRRTNCIVSADTTTTVNFALDQITTNVTGVISTNTTWYYANSPYIVTGHVLVNQGVTLTIEPGVEVKFSDDTYLRVDGTLVARGTAADKIIFTTNNSTPTAGDWDSIKFTDTSNDSKCIISYAEIKYAQYGVYGDKAAPTITYSTITYNSDGGIYLSFSSASETPTISNNVITNNGTYNSGTGIYSMASPTINNNIIQNNYVGVNAYSGGRPVISNNIISYNCYGISTSYNSPMISNNSISNNTYGTYSAYHENPNVPVTLKRNTITGNINAIYNNGANMVITRNTITDNGTGITVYGNYSSTITYNNIYNSTATYNIDNKSAKDIIANNNWWGTTNTSTIDSKIYDYTEDFNYGKVLYAPIAGSTNDIYLNTAPTLSSLGTNDYVSDGLHPQTGDTNTNFTYKVKYTDTDNDPPSAGYPRVYIKKGGVNISGSPFAMTYESGSSETGAQYTYSTTFSSAGTNYTYYFEAYDIMGATATGTPTSSVDAPDVTTAVTATQNESRNEVVVTVTRNLFNPVSGQNAGIKFDLSSGDNVTVTVFDVMGNQVRSLVKQVNYNSGSVNVPWDGRNDNGNIVAPGLYLVYIKVGDKMQVKQVAISAR